MTVDRPETLLPGDRFHGYIVIRLLGRGGLGDVYLVRHEMLDTLYALKVLAPDVVENNPEYVRRFLREAKLATRIRHVNLVSVHDCGRDGERGVYYLVMDYIAGGNLRGALGLAGRFEASNAVNVVLQLVSALEAAQSFHMVHRDIKPENIMLQPDGTVKLVDLGIAKADNLGDSLRTTTNSIFGTPAYVSPEQAKNAGNVDERADIYSLGVVFFEMLAGRPPYQGRTAPQILAQVLSDDPTPDIRDFAPDVAPPLAVLVRRMCMKDLDRRIGSYAALRHELAKLGYVSRTKEREYVEYTPTSEAECEQGGSAFGVDLDRLPENDPTLSFETEDESVRAFVKKLKRRRLLKKILFLLSALLLAAAVVCVLSV